MSKDYAKRVFLTNRSHKKKRRRIELLILPVFMIAVIVGIWGYMHQAYVPGNKTTFLSRAKTLFTHKTVAAHQSAVQPTETAEMQPEVHFDFYSELPKMQVPVTEVAESAPPPKPIVKKSHVDEEASNEDESSDDEANDSQYILQLGLYKDKTSAVQQRLSLLLAGCEASIVKVESEKGDVYRLQSGPFTTAESAKNLQKKLRAKGIISVIKEV